MGRSLSVLDHVRIASPCPASWTAMQGDDRRRFCRLCNLNVYNISEMDRDEAERLISQTEGRLCVRYYVRRDGTILTRDCPVGLARVRRRLRRMFAAVAALITISSTVALSLGSAQRRRIHLTQIPPFSLVWNWVYPRPGFTTGIVVNPRLLKTQPTAPVGQGTPSAKQK